MNLFSVMFSVTWGVSVKTGASPKIERFLFLGKKMGCHRKAIDERPFRFGSFFIEIKYRNLCYRDQYNIREVFCTSTPSYSATTNIDCGS